MYASALATVLHCFQLRWRWLDSSFQVWPAWRCAAFVWGARQQSATPCPRARRIWGRLRPHGCTSTG